MPFLRKIDSVSRGHENRLPAPGSEDQARWLVCGLLAMFTGNRYPEITGPTPVVTCAEAIIEAVRAGNTHADAAHWAGVWPETLSRWTTRGLEELSRMATENTENPRNTEEPYVNLTLELLHASAAFKLSAGAQWQSHFPRDWRSIHKFMAVRFPAEYGEKPRSLELSGPGGAPMTIAAVTLSASEAEAMLAAADARGAMEALEGAESVPALPAAPGGPAGAPVGAEGAMA